MIMSGLLATSCRYTGGEAGAEGAETVGAVYFPFYLLAMRGGDARSADAICALVREAGFVDVAVRKTRSPLFTGLITARR